MKQTAAHVVLWLWHRSVISVPFSGKISLERERLEADRKDRECRFELESQERQVILDLLKEKVLKNWETKPADI